MNPEFRNLGRRPRLKIQYNINNLLFVCHYEFELERNLNHFTREILMKRLKLNNLIYFLIHINFNNESFFIRYSSMSSNKERMNKSTQMFKTHYSPKFSPNH